MTAGLRIGQGGVARVGRGRIGRGAGLLWWVAAAVVTVLAIEAVPTLLPDPALVAAAQVAPVDATVAAPEGRVSLQPVLDFQPFGSAAQPVEAAPLAEDDAPVVDTGAVLVLQGVLLREAEGLSRAMISADGGPAQGFGLGDVLPGGGTLTAIAADQIRIDLDGQIQTLGFPEPGSVVKGAGDTAGDPQNGADVNAGGDPNAEVMPVVPVLEPGDAAVPAPDLRHLIPGLVADAPGEP